MVMEETNTKGTRNLYPQLFVALSSLKRDEAQELSCRSKLLTIMYRWQLINNLTDVDDNTYVEKYIKPYRAPRREHDAAPADATIVGIEVGANHLPTTPSQRLRQSRGAL